MSKVAGTCPVTNTQLMKSDMPDMGWRYDCPICGKFDVTGSALPGLLQIASESEDDAAILSHHIRRNSDSGIITEFHSNTARGILEHASLPTVSEQADSLILWLGGTLKFPSKRTTIIPDNYPAVIGALDGQGVMFILHHLNKGNLIELKVTRDGQRVQLTYDGWLRYSELLKGRSSSTKAFMAMPYEVDELDMVLDKCFRPAVKKTGFRLVRLDEEPKAGLIDDRMRVEIRAARFLIAELTGGNNGAYWEAGYAEGLGKPVIYTCSDEVEKPHFDTNHHLTVFWNKNELDTAAEKLKATIRFTIPEARQKD